MPPSHNQYHDLVILPFLVNGMPLLCKPSKFPPIWWVTSPAYIIHQNFLFWNFHQNHSPKKFPFLETISKFGSHMTWLYKPSKFPFLVISSKSKSGNLSFFGSHMTCLYKPSKFPFWEVTWPASICKSHDLPIRPINRLPCRGCTINPWENPAGYQKRKSMEFTSFLSHQLIVINDFVPTDLP